MPQQGMLNQYIYGTFFDTMANIFELRETFCISNPVVKAIAENPDYIFGLFTYMLFSITEESDEER